MEKPTPSPNLADEGEASHGADSIKRHCVRYDCGPTFTYAEIKAGRLKAKKAGRKTLLGHVEQQRWWESLPEIEQKPAA